MPRGKDTSSHPSRKVHREGISGRQQGQAQPSGKGMYRIQGESGGYLSTEPVEGSEGRRHNVSYYSDDHKLQYGATGAEFSHDPETKEVKFWGGKEKGSGQQMGHTWSAKSHTGNVHFEPNT